MWEIFDPYNNFVSEQKSIGTQSSLPLLLGSLLYSGGYCCFRWAFSVPSHNQRDGNEVGKQQDEVEETSAKSTKKHLKNLIVSFFVESDFAEGANEPLLKEARITTYLNQIGLIPSPAMQVKPCIASIVHRNPENWNVPSNESPKPKSAAMAKCRDFAALAKVADCYWSVSAKLHTFSG